MSNIVNLDVLVVYSSSIATSASVADEKIVSPFQNLNSSSDYNLPYGYLLDSCQKRGLNAGLTTSSDVIGPGMCQNFWSFDQGKWLKNDKQAFSNTIFDKLSPVTSLRASERNLLLSDESIKPFISKKIYKIFFDKLLTYKNFTEDAIPTVAIKSNNVFDINLAINNLFNLVKIHPNRFDFSRTIVMKDRYGAGGNHVYLIEEDYFNQIKKILGKNPEIKFIIQPFLFFDKGFIYNNKLVSTDIRLIFHHNKLLQSYIRIAKDGDFRCNEHLGGSLVYIENDTIPKQILNKAKKIVEKLASPRSLYALDFAISNLGNPYLVEGNSGPGIDWNDSKKINEKMSKQLIQSIVTELKFRATKS